ncbi:MAG: membrane protein insertase YidC, partial [Neisseriaceae bacterium]|nr:membrane protein insertase YidC [Neisseriaceae bacterium]
MNPRNNQNHGNLILFMIIAMAILLGWNYIFPPPAQTQVNQSESTQNAVQVIEQAPSLQNGQLISVKTDVFDAKIDMNSGDLRDLVLTRYNAADDENKQFV